MVYKLIFFITIWCIFGMMPDIQAQTGGINTVVIDAGHGGKDCGAVGSKTKEKDITLKVALKAGEYIRSRCPDVKVIYTRSKDTSVDLYSRASIANKNDADVFISIHCNSIANSPKTGGAETFIMGQHRSEANLNVAKTENASILYEENVEEHYGGFDPNSTETYIALTYLQNEYNHESLELAELVQNELVTTAKRHDRKVQQAGFLVLWKTSMPSILVELGFISNPTEETYMASAEGQDKLASAICQAFCTYRDNYNKDAVGLEHDQSNENKVVITDDGIVYKVQFTTKNRKVDNPSAVYKNLRDIECYEHNGMFKYTTGRFRSLKEADEYKNEVVAKGYNGAFVVKFENGKRVE